MTTKKAKAAPAVIGKALTFPELVAEMQAKRQAEMERRAAMTPAELAEQERKDAENEKEIEEIMKSLPGLVRIQF